jgi:hypothetical protein
VIGGTGVRVLDPGFDSVAPEHAHALIRSSPVQPPVRGAAVLAESVWPFGRRVMKNRHLHATGADAGLALGRFGAAAGAPRLSTSLAPS